MVNTGFVINYKELFDCTENKWEMVDNQFVYAGGYIYSSSQKLGDIPDIIYRTRAIIYEVSRL